MSVFRGLLPFTLFFQTLELNTLFVYACKRGLNSHIVVGKVTRLKSGYIVMHPLNEMSGRVNDRLLILP